jgi:dephospho-CoA kinase
MLICVTGIKGSGKTTTMNIIKKNGFDIFIMDRWIHQIYKTNNIGFILIKDNFGNKYIGKNGVNRKKLGKLVFSNSLQLAKLNKIMIPIMQQKLSELLSENKLIFVELAIYLYHVNKFKKYFHKIIHI